MYRFWPSFSPFPTLKLLNIHRWCCSATGKPPMVGVAAIQRGALQSAASARVRGRVENFRVRGKLAFIQLRQPPSHSIQVVAAGAEISHRVKELTPESIVDVIGVIKPTERPATSVSCSNYELHATSIEVVSKAAVPLPFPLHDQNAKLDTRLNNRYIDMRTPLAVAMIRLVSAAAQSFRTQLLSRDFVELHTPKIIGTASEGGSALFSLDYFGRQAFLAQSPQLYKQMAIMGDGMRVFEIGPVFRAEKSLTHRHLTEFTGLDAEFTVDEFYTELLDVLESILCGMIWKLQTENAEWISQARAALMELDSAEDCGTVVPRREDIVCEVAEEIIAMYNIRFDDAASRIAPSVPTEPSEDRYHARIGISGPKVLRMTFRDALQLIRDNDHQHAGRQQEVVGESDEEVVVDFNLNQERALGELIRLRYGVDLYVVDQFPLAARPFYTMPHPSEEGVACGFDMYLRGEEICSGGQRIHDVAQLIHSMEQRRMEAAHMRDYVDSFRYGAWPHGGFGLGLERIVLFLLGARDIRRVSLFPRDPRRLAP
ncbi:aspartyl-tRNA synthetase, putative [Trypanosoma equiperdum]|uniref:aspartate--tRNA ligase n=1 Tax=Trypanosoma equiperdum TaxID=5694 RepID=A0A1G4IBT4_TRYEQ|nr:aspartyl-tRNA synthetase, putative [Trypanosoma equiperdum]